MIVSTLLNDKCPGIILLAFILCLNACTCNKSKKNADVTGVDIHIEIKRFEKDLMATDTTGIVRALQALKKEYPDFYDCYFENVVRVKDSMTPVEEYAGTVSRVLNYGGFRAAYDSAMLQYDELDWLEEDLTDAFSRYAYYFPGKPVPKIVTFISEYAYGAVTCNDSTLGIGLDLFLGADFTFYPALRFPEYMYNNFKRELIVPSAMMAQATEIWGQEPQTVQMLAHMIHKGKLLYLMDIFLPETQDHLKIGFSKEQMEWCRNNEDRIWAFFVEKDLIYSTDPSEFSAYVNEGPNSPGMPIESPGNTGSWIGWQIVKKYMKENPDITPQVLMEKTEATTILSRSRYKPVRDGLL